MHVLGDIMLPSYSGLPIFCCCLLDKHDVPHRMLAKLNFRSVDEARLMMRGYEAA